MAGQTSSCNREHRMRGPVGPRSSDNLASVLVGLEQLRSSLHHALDELEEMARQRVGEPLEVDARIDRRLRDLQRAQHEFQAETERWEQARREQLEALDQDRRQLAAAWELLEQEQLAALATQPKDATPPPRDAMAPVSVRRVVATSASESPMTRAILEQFEVLRRDVRRNNQGRHSH